ncbi:MAG: LptF/LptG family permease [Phycisphaerae bacterium]
MTTLDRYLLRSLLVNYVIALAIMMSLYMVLDLFFNVDEFTESGESLWTVCGNIVSYYGAHSCLYFSQLSGVITLFACMTTLARMRRANELTAVLASGVSLYRVAVPVLAFGVATSLFWYVDTQVVMPRIAHLLARSHDDATGQRSRGVWFANDGPALLSALRFFPAQGRMEKVLILHRNEHGAVGTITQAEEAVWETSPAYSAGGIWRLRGGVEMRRVIGDDPLGPRDSVERHRVTSYESRLSPKAMEARQFEQWLKYLSSWQLASLDKQEPVLADRIRQARHVRFATPFVHLLMLLLGLPFFLSREPANMVSDAGKCLAVCGLCYFLAYSSTHFVKASTLPALPAWLPLIVFAPVAVVLIDRIRT